VHAARHPNVGSGVGTGPFAKNAQVAVVVAFGDTSSAFVALFVRPGVSERVGQALMSLESSDRGEIAQVNLTHTT